jgi:hypothetical protein
MKIVKCDICGKYVEVWHEVQNESHQSEIFDVWKTNSDRVKIQDMCLDCKKEVEEAVNKIILSLYKKN